MPRPRDWRLPAFLAFVAATARLMGGRLPYGMLFLWLALCVTAYLWTWMTARRVRATLRAERRTAVAGQRVRFELELSGGGWLPVPYAILADGAGAPFPLCPGGFHLLTPPGRGRSVHVLTSPPLRRGRYRPGPLILTVGDPFGFFRMSTVVRGEEEVVVVPRLHPVPWFPLAPGAPVGRAPARGSAYQDVTDLAGLRPFVTGDNPGHIHWRTSARRGRPHVREFGATATAFCLLFVEGEPAERAAALDRAAEVAASLARYALARHCRVALAAGPATLVPAAEGQAHLGRVLEALADLAPLAAAGRPASVPVGVGRAASAPAAGRTEAPALARHLAGLPPRSTVVAIGSRLTEGTAAGLVQALAT
ncbi:MAG: DUF58 domain-containing protein, partial [Clostridia bacterium]|nr:DUF58 domain-containing protein [Clostridia bacterium]